MTAEIDSQRGYGHACRLAPTCCYWINDSIRLRRGTRRCASNGSVFNGLESTWWLRVAWW